MACAVDCWMSRGRVLVLQKCAMQLEVLGVEATGPDGRDPAGRVAGPSVLKASSVLAGTRDDTSGCAGCAEEGLSA